VKIGVDVDGVLADFVSAHRQISRELFGKPENPDTLPTDWNLSNYGLTDAEFDAVWERIKATRNFWMSLKPEPHAGFLEMDELEQQHELYFITSRVPTKGWSVAQQTSMWLDKNYQLFRPIVIPSGEKGLLVKALKIDAFIDDNWKNCVDIKQRNPETCRVFLANASHNQDKDAEARGIVRIADFDTFAKQSTQEAVAA
jgi:uncharacterized HAD superfamily protein